MLVNYEQLSEKYHPIHDKQKTWNFGLQEDCTVVFYYHHQNKAALLFSTMHFDDSIKKTDKDESQKHKFSRKKNCWELIKTQIQRR